MRLNWTDQYLSWDPNDFGGLKQIHFGQSEIWKPDIQLYNNADSANMQHFGTTHFLVFNTGVVLWVPPAKFRAFCKVDLRQWPHDSQSCKLKFGSWTSHGDQIDLGLYHDMDTVDKLNFYTENKEWKVDSSTATRSENKYETVAETYPDVTFTFQISRRSPSYRAAIILPCLLTMLLVVTSFLLPPTAGEDHFEFNLLFSLLPLHDLLPIKPAGNGRPHASHSSLLLKYGGSRCHCHPS